MYQVACLMACNSLVVREEEHNNQLGKLKHIENVDFVFAKWYHCSTFAAETMQWKVDKF